MAGTEDIRAMMRTAIKETEAELERLKAGLRALGEEPEVRTDERRNSWHRGRAFTEWLSQQPVGIEVTREQLRTQFGYTSSSTPLSSSRWFKFTRLGMGRYRYDGCTGNVPRQDPEQGYVRAAIARQQALGLPATSRPG
ncbi:MAG: hypothetical protein HN380_31470 [Victivallales bacterium]|nr:hypothetical protein [Victivallales bacterium]